MSDTERPPGTRHPRPDHVPGAGSHPAARSGRQVLTAALILAAALARPAAARPAPIDARVVWVRGPHAYIASSDSLALPRFSILTFALKERPVATGELERIVDGGMAVARITSGSLAGVRDLERLRITAEPPRGPRLLRVGVPSERRAHLLFACEGVAIVPGAWRTEGEGPSIRLIRDGDDPGRSAWPDTLVLRAFDDAADQEIAFERGELDVAVFWPGELSTHLREHPRWQDLISWPLAHGLIGTLPGSGSSASRCTAAFTTARAFRSLGERLFRGDLDVPREAACEDTLPAGTVAVRYEVDPSCPGRATLERFLNRDLAPGPGADASTVVRVSCDDPRAFSSSDVVAATARCQALCAPEILPYLKGLGPGPFASLLDCIGPGRRP